MKKATKMLLILLIVFLLTGCSNYLMLDKAPSKEQEQEQSQSEAVNDGTTTAPSKESTSVTNEVESVKQENAQSGQ